MKKVNLADPPPDREHPKLVKGAGIYMVGACIVVFAVISYLAYLIAWYTTDPSFEVAVTHEASGAYRFEVSPNFVVNSIYHISVTGPAGILAESTNSRTGAQTLTVPSGLTPNDNVTVECSLQFDRLVPSTATKAKSLVVR